MEVKSQHGALKMTYRCKKCSKYCMFNSTTLNDHSPNVTMTAGCTHATYKKVRDIIGIAAVPFQEFMDTIQKIHPVVERMDDGMCEREKQQMKEMDQKTRGSWSEAVICAD